MKRKRLLWQIFPPMVMVMIAATAVILAAMLIPRGAPTRVVLFHAGILLEMPEGQA